MPAAAEAHRSDPRERLPVRIPLLLALTLALESCSGAGPSVSGGPAAGTAPAPQTTGSSHTTVQFTITIPSRVTQAAGRAAAFVSPATQSVTIDLVTQAGGTHAAGFPMTANLTSGASGCTSTLVSVQCDVVMPVAPAAYNATFTTYDLPGGSGGGGHLLSAAQTVPITVAEGQANTLPLALGGVPTSVSMVAAGGLVTGSRATGFTLETNRSGSIAAYGVDADGNVIVGAGAPAISVTTSDASQIAVTQPTNANPNLFSVSSVALNTTQQITATITPVAASGASPISATVNVQAKTPARLYAADYGLNTVDVYDLDGTKLTLPGGFPGLSYPYSVAYDATNGFVYVYGQGYMREFDLNGNPQSVSGSFPSLPSAETMMYVAASDLIYVVGGGGTGAAYHSDGTAAFTFTLPTNYALTYATTSNLIYGAGISVITTAGAPASLSGSFSAGSNASAMAYSSFNNLIYVATVYPSAVYAIDVNANQQTLSGSFPGYSGSVQSSGMAVDPTSGNVYLSTNTGVILGYDANGNALPNQPFASGVDDLRLIIVPAH
jgi:hypothetical protein